MLELELVEGKRLRNVLWPLFQIREEATVLCNQKSMYLQASDTDGAIVAILRFHSGFFDRYLVNTVRMAGVGLHALESILATTDDEDSITVRANCQFNLINFTFEDVETHESRNMAADIVAIPQYHVPFDDSIYRYEVVVGVPSEEFRRIFVTLRNVGPGAAVVYITASKVRFYTIGQEITLTKENGECIIGGVKDDNEIICIPASLHKIDPILEASKLCGTVWLLYSTRHLTDSGRPPTVINCPIGHLDSWLTSASTSSRNRYRYESYNCG